MALLTFFLKKEFNYEQKNLMHIVRHLLFLILRRRPGYTLVTRKTLDLSHEIVITP
jgi:hypothetical protein